jgi:hypothetical protein
VQAPGPDRDEPSLTGVWRSTPVPSPTCPKEFCPQAQTWPAPLRATLWSAPAETSTIVSVVGSVTRTGVVRFVVVPSPSWP